MAPGQGKGIGGGHNLRSAVLRIRPNLKEVALNHPSELPRLLHVLELLRKQDASKRTEQATGGASEQQLPGSARTRRRRRGEQRPAGDASILQALSPVDHRRRAEQLAKDYQEIRQWFFDDPKYLEWLKGRSWHLCCYGERKCGKSSFAAAVACNLEKDISESETNAAVIVLFLTASLTGASEPFDRSVLRAIFRQLLEWKLRRKIRSPRLDELASSVNQQLLSDKDLQYWQDVVSHEIHEYEKVFLIVDGLEHLSDTDQHSVKSQLSRLAERCSAGSAPITRIMLVQSQTDSRPSLSLNCAGDCDDPDFELYWQCSSCKDGQYHVCNLCFNQGLRCLSADHEMREPYTTREVQLRSTDEELAVYVRKQLESAVASSTDFSQQLSEISDMSGIEDAILSRSSGVFVFVRLYIDYITQKQSLHDVFNILDRLPQHEDEYFSSLLQKVLCENDEDNKQLALHALLVAATAAFEATPIDFTELADGVARLLGRNSRMNEHDLLRITKGLLSIESSTRQEVKPFHDDVTTYLYENCIEVFAPLQLNMAEVCISTLISLGNQSEAVFGESDSCTPEFYDKEFLRYASRNWASHLDRNFSGDVNLVCELAKVYETSRMLRRVTFLALNDGERRERWTGNHAMHLFACFGLHRYWTCLPRRNADINTADSISGQTALHIACIHGHVDLVQAVLTLGADSTIVDSEGRNALWIAIEHTRRGDSSSPNVVDILLDVAEKDQRRSAELLNYRNQKSGNRTPLMLAIDKGQVVTVDRVLQHPGLDIQVIDDCGRTALHYAASAMTRAISTILDMFSKHCSAVLSKTLSIAASPGGCSPAMLLLTSTDLRDDQKLSVIQHWCQLDPNIVKLADNLGHTLLHYAVIHVEERHIVDFLISQGVDIDRENMAGYTALDLHLAQEESSLESDIAQSLIAGGASPKCRNDSHAPQHEMWKMILDSPDTFQQVHGPQLSELGDVVLKQLGPECQTLLHCAITVKDIEIVKLLVEDTRIDLNAISLHGLTALQHAVVLLTEEDENETGPLETIIDILLAKDIHLEVPNLHGQTALQVSMMESKYCPALLRVAVMLINHNVQPKLSRHDKLELLRYAVKNDDIPIARQLFSDANADPFEFADEGQLPSQSVKKVGGSEEMHALFKEVEERLLASL